MLNTAQWMEESKMKKVSAAFLVVLLVMCSSSAFADLYHVSIDLSGLGGSDVELLAALYDNSGTAGDSWALMDNVVLGSASDDFESGLGGFNAGYNPGSVNTVGGNLNGDGNYVMRIDEASDLIGTFVYQDYFSPSGSTLVFDLGVAPSDTAGFRYKDEFVISILNPETGYGLFEGVTGHGWGDILVINADGAQYTDVVTLSPVPLPAAVLLGLLGFGTAALGLKRQR
jgi:hypothetical protein